MITDGIGWHEVLLPINHNHYNFWKKKKHLGQTSPVGTMSKGKNLKNITRWEQKYNLHDKTLDRVFSKSNI